MREICEFKDAMETEPVLHLDPNWILHNKEHVKMCHPECLVDLSIRLPCILCLYQKSTRSCTCTVYQDVLSTINDTSLEKSSAWKLVKEADLLH